MSILVTGSVAIDHIMVFQDRVKNHILPDQLAVLRVAFVAPTLDKRWGGTGAKLLKEPSVTRQVGGGGVLMVRC